jgi:flagellar FliL protein
MGRTVSFHRGGFVAENSAAAKVAEDSATGQKFSSKSSLVLVLLAILNMGFIGAVAYMLHASRTKEKSQPGIEAVIQGEIKTQADEKAVQEKSVKPIVQLETFIVNLAGSRGRRVAKVSLELEMNSIGAKSEIERRHAQVRDIIIMVLSSKTYEVVSSREGKEDLKKEIMDMINTFISVGRVENVFFTEFIYN